jgi:hypothetical protein
MTALLYLGGSLEAMDPCLFVTQFCHPPRLSLSSFACYKDMGTR